jgi:hypothetical protein
MPDPIPAAPPAPVAGPPGIPTPAAAFAPPRPTPGPRPAPPSGASVSAAEAAGPGPVLVGETGVEAVDAALGRLEELADVPAEGQAAFFESIHEQLRQTLASLDQPHP